MGIMPPYDPFQDRALTWAVAKPVALAAPTATWSRPTKVDFDRVESLAGEPAPRFSVIFGAPREAGQAYFYAQRDLIPRGGLDEAAQRELRRRTEALDATAVELPEIGRPVIVWLAGTGPEYDIPTLRLPSAWPFEHHARFIPATEANLAEVRRRLAGRGV